MYKKTIFIGATLCAFGAFNSSAFAQNASVDTGNAQTPPDNTSVNQRDKSPDAVKATDQPNDTTNIRVAAAVRKAIVDDTSLSTTAHNVKLVASNGVVTLRGPVNNPREKAKIGQIAASVSGVSSVDNQLDIKTTH
jgi:hyperosmotically inducible periplasmic protein